LNVPLPVNNIPVGQNINASINRTQISLGDIVNNRDNTMSPEHIIEIEYCVPGKKALLFEALRKKGATIKQLDGQRFIAIFKTTAVAKETLQTFKGKDFTLRPFMFQIGSGFESFASNRCPKPNAQNLLGKDLSGSDQLLVDDENDNPEDSISFQKSILTPSDLILISNQ
jgi:hypothetical protein